MSKPTRQDAFEAVAKSLREFGYPQTTADMVSKCWDAMAEGKKDLEMPHGVVGAFAYSQLNENKEWIEKLP